MEEYYIKKSIINCSSVRYFTFDLCKMYDPKKERRILRSTG